MFGFVCRSSTLGLLAPRIGPPLAPARRIVPRPQHHSNLFGMTSLAAPRHLTPMESYRCLKTLGATPHASTATRPSYSFPYILPSSVCSKPCFFILLQKRPGWGAILPILVHLAVEANSTRFTNFEFRISRFGSRSGDSQCSTGAMRPHRVSS